jgi:hypothetical protein
MEILADFFVRGGIHTTVRVGHPKLATTSGTDGR